MNYSEEKQGDQLKEIDLLDIIRIVKKRKKMILIVFSIGLVAGVFWYFFAPSNYQGTVILKIGGYEKLVEATSKKSMEYFENINEIAERLRKGAYGDYPPVEVINPQNTNLLEINLAMKSRGQTQEILEEVKRDILSIHGQKAENRKQTLDQETAFLREKIENLNKDISFFAARGEETALLKLEIYNMEKLINGLEREKANIWASEALKGPEMVEKRPGYLSILFVGALGLFIGLLSAFFKDWFEKNRKKI
jgi:hypothetical protein